MSTPTMHYSPEDRPLEWHEVEVVSTEPVTLRLAAVVALRLEAGDAALVRAAAQRDGVTQAEYLRRAAVGAARARMAQPDDESKEVA